MVVAQLMAAARKRMDARRAREAAGRAFAEANAGMARISEAEKTFTSQVWHGHFLHRSHSVITEEIWITLMKVNCYVIVYCISK